MWGSTGNPEPHQRPRPKPNIRDPKTGKLIKAGALVKSYEPQKERIPYSQDWGPTPIFIKRLPKTARVNIGPENIRPPFKYLHTKLSWKRQIVSPYLQVHKHSPLAPMVEEMLDYMEANMREEKAALEETALRDSAAATSGPLFALPARMKIEEAARLARQEVSLRIDEVELEDTKETRKKYRQKLRADRLTKASQRELRRQEMSAKDKERTEEVRKTEAVERAAKKDAKEKSKAQPQQ